MSLPVDGGHPLLEEEDDSRPEAVVEVSLEHPPFEDCPEDFRLQGEHEEVGVDTFRDLETAEEASVVLIGQPLVPAHHHAKTPSVQFPFDRRLERKAQGVRRGGRGWVGEVCGKPGGSGSRDALVPFVGAEEKNAPWDGPPPLTRRALPEVGRP